MKKPKGPLCHWCWEPKHRGADGRFINGLDVCWRMQHCKRMFDEEMNRLETGFFRAFTNLRDDQGRLVNEPRFIGEPPQPRT
jgi:hypothetical protein